MRACVGRFSRSRRGAAGLLLAAAVLAAGAPARAEESPYCAKVRARAEADASLLFAPTLQAQGIKFPNNGTIDAGVTVGRDYQLRAGATWSPLDFYKGFRVLDVGDADCERHEAALNVQEALAFGIDLGRLPALEKQDRFLESKRPTWEQHLAAAEQRLEAHVASLLEVNEVRARGAELARKHAQVKGELERLRLRGVPAQRGALGSLVAAADERSMRYEREVKHVRSLDAWDLRVTGGVVPHSGGDFFGVVQLGFNLGAFSRNAAESRYLTARAEELRGARYEAREGVRRLREQARSAVQQARRELEILDKQAARVEQGRALLEGSEAPNAPQARTVIELESIFLESDRVFLTALVEELSRLEEKNGH